MILATRAPASVIDMSEDACLAREVRHTASRTDTPLLVTDCVGYWREGTVILPATIAVVFHVTKLDGLTGTFAVDIDDSTGHENVPLTIGGPIQPTGPGFYTIPLDVEPIYKMTVERDNHVYIATRFTKTGGAGEIAYSAYIGK